MTRALLIQLALALAVVAASGGTVRAQLPSTMTAVIAEIGTRATVSPPIPLTSSINYAECVSNASVSIVVNGIPATATELDFWFGQTCNDQTTRASTTDLSCVACLHTYPTMGATMIIIPSDVDTILGIGLNPRNVVGPVARTCENVAFDGDSQVFVTVNATSASCDVTAAPLATTTVDNTGGMKLFTADTTPPGPPLTVTAGDGDTAVPVMWQPPTSLGLGMGGFYNVYVAAASGGGDGGAACSSSLVAGAVAPATPTQGDVVAINTMVDASALGIAFGGTGAVAVSTVDRALNVSVLSNVACFNRTQSFGFYSMYAADGGTTPKCSVVAPGSGGGRAGIGAVALGLIGLGVALRLRSKRRG